MSDLPRELGYRMPAEWEPHQATWLSWPHNRRTWPGGLEPVWPRYADMIAAISHHETVHINVNDLEWERQAKQFLQEAGASSEVVFHHFPTNDAWCRDHGAIFVVRDRSDQPLAATNWNYNAWGQKYPSDLDAEISRQMAEFLDVPRFRPGIILEGGSIDINGEGLVLTTESCLLNPNRNPGLNRTEIEQKLHDYLAIDQVYWLGAGIAGDDTDGHVDDITRFVSARTIVTAVERDPSDENYQALKENRDRLQSMRAPDGKPFEIVELPMPPALVRNGQRLPASYANFYIANGIVLLPVFGVPSDETAKSILQDLFPDREIVGIDCTDIVWGLGAFHCLTQQVPAV
ncbi:MAG TPA: agmatine deiminase family protein [Planctomycetaceae bacterium]|nr:agmatine deiminase family protein [Planctomycetaceae bacterium]